MPVVYMDVVWLVNFAMDAVILLCTGWIVKRKLRAGKILIGAAIGSFYSLVLFFPSLEYATTWPMKAVVSLIMVAMAIPWSSWMDLARVALMYYFVAFIFAGAAIALHFAIPGVSIEKGTIMSGSGLIFATSIGTLGLMVAIPVSVGLLRFAIGRARQIQLRASMLFQVHVEMNGKTVSFVGLADTGNQLRDPLTRHPVCFVVGRVVEDLMPEPIRLAIRQEGNLVNALSEVHDGTWMKHFALIPYRGAGGMQQMTIAFRPETVEFVRDGVRSPALSECLFALQTQPLSTDGRFDAILHTELITGDESFENHRIPSDPKSQTAHSTSTLVDSGASQTSRRL